MSEPTVADKALDHCLEIVAEAASPWTVEDDILDDLRVTFQTDFEREIDSGKAWGAWARKARRLARYVGTLAAFEADRASGFSQRPTSLRREDLEAAVRAVVDGCPTKARDGAGRQGRLCAAVVRSSSGAVRLGVRPDGLDTRRLRLHTSHRRSRG